MIGDLRFKPSIPNQPWDGILDATEFGPICPQNVAPMFKFPPMPQSEPDCLTLNIWTPATDDQQRPVMVYIHGGGFRFGSGRDYYARARITVSKLRGRHHDAILPKMGIYRRRIAATQLSMECIYPYFKFGYPIGYMTLQC
jgi:hypothetical protein